MQSSLRSSKERASATSSTEASSSMDNSPVNAYQQRKTTHAEELANRLIAFSCNRTADFEERVGRKPSRTKVAPSCDNVRVAPLPPPPITKPSRVNTKTGTGARKVPPPPPPRALKQKNDDDTKVVPVLRRSSSFDLSTKDVHQKITTSDVKTSSSFHDHQRSVKSDLCTSLASLHTNQRSVKSDFGSSAASFLSSRDFNEATNLGDTPRKVRVSQFNDEPEERLESLESLPSNCDKKGRCINHPNVKLYSRLLLGGFQLVLATCPLCEADNVDAEIPTNSRPTIVIKRSTFERIPSVEYVRSSSVERRSSLNFPVTPDKPKQVRKAMSETEANPRVPGGSSFLNDKRSKYVETGPPSTEYSRSVSEESKASSARGSPITVVKPRFSRKAMSETDANTRVSGGSAFLNDKRSKYLEIGPSSEYSRTGSEESKPSSPRGSPLSIVKPKISRKAMSESDQPSHDPIESPFLYDNQASSSILERGLEKLNLLSGKTRSSSRRRGSSGASTVKLCSVRSDTESVCVSTYTQKSKSGQKLDAKPKFDNSGRCKKHPSVILARKKAFAKGWDLIRDSCPLCAEARLEVSVSKINHLLGREKSPAPARAALTNDFNSSFHSGGSSPSSIITPSFEETVRSRSRSMPRCKLDGSNQSAARNSNEGSLINDTMQSDISRVQKMPYTTPWGETGWYTGDVNENGKPHGRGRMRFKTGNTYDGFWINGYSEEYLERKKRMNSGFGTNVAPWKQNATSPHFETTTRPSTGSVAQTIRPPPPQYDDRTMRPPPPQYDDRTMRPPPPQYDDRTMRPPPPQHDDRTTRPPPPQYERQMQQYPQRRTHCHPAEYAPQHWRALADADVGHVIAYDGTPS